MRIETKATDVVHNLRTRVERAPRNTRPPGIDGYRDLYCWRERLNYWNNPATLLFFGNRLVPRTCGFAANIDDIGAVFFNLPSARDRLIGIEILTGIRKGIRSHIQDTHHRRPLAKHYRRTRKIPDVFRSHFSFNSRPCDTEP